MSNCQHHNITCFALKKIRPISNVPFFAKTLEKVVLYPVRQDVTAYLPVV